MSIVAGAWAEDALQKLPSALYVFGRSLYLTTTFAASIVSSTPSVQPLNAYRRFCPAFGVLQVHP